MMVMVRLPVTDRPGCKIITSREVVHFLNLTEIKIQSTYELSGPKINMELLLMIGTFLCTFRRRIIRPASRKLWRVLSGTVLAENKQTIKKKRP